MLQKKIMALFSALQKLRKASFRFAMSVCLSVRMEKLRLPMDGILWNMVLEYIFEILRNVIPVVRVEIVYVGGSQ